MVNPLTWLSKRRFPYEPLISIEISKTNLLHNLHEFQKIAPEGKVAPVQKSNAYGHGFSEVANILSHEKNIPFFVVDSYFEAIALHSEGIHADILIMGYSRPEMILASRLRNVIFTISSLEALQELEGTETRIHIHLKIDTGMHRQGILPTEVDKAIDLICENPLIELGGITSHLSDADNTDSSFTEAQINIWNNTVQKFKSKFTSLKYIHLSATYGHVYNREIDANVSRLGIGLYGLVDGVKFPSDMEFLPVLTMKTIITGVKSLKRDETVGYSNTFKAQKDMTIATIPAGYFEGVDRRLSNVGFVTVGSDNIPCPIIGRVSMNISIIDVSGVPNVKIGMPVTIISSDPSAPNSIRNIARLCNTIPYEIAVHIPEHLKRIIK